MYLYVFSLVCLGLVLSDILLSNKSKVVNVQHDTATICIVETGTIADP